MKRRNAECGKLRRPLKRNKITEGMYGSTLLYMKFLVLWALVILADFILEFRFEFLWPFWLLLRSVYDSFKYQGLAFSAFFICISFTSDMICFFFIPVHWLFFAASTYVWVQYVWHTEKGICLPTIILWLLFIYVEAAVRLRDLRHLPFHLDLCRPFAAHCIGYPVVTLGFGFKSYVGYRMRQRKQRVVAKENEFYLQLLQQALPPEQLSSCSTQQQQSLQPSTAPTTPSLTDKSKVLASTEGASHSQSNGHGPHHGHSQPSSSAKNNHRKSLDKGGSSAEPELSGGGASSQGTQSRQQQQQAAASAKFPQANGTITGDIESVNDFDENEADKEKSFTKGSLCKANNTAAKWPSGGSAAAREQARDNAVNSQREKRNKANREPPAPDNTKDEYSLSERGQSSKLTQLQADNETLQQKLHGLVTARQADKSAAAQLERRLAEERRARSSAESQLAAERKAKKAEEAATARAIAMAAAAAAAKTDCTESCRARRRDLEGERVLQHALDILAQMLRPYKESHSDAEVLYSALSAMQDKNVHLESSLSAETRIKLDLFSALGEVKRQLEIRENLLRVRDQEIEELKSKFAQVVAVADSLSPAALDLVGHSMSSAPSSKLLLAGDHSPLGCTSNLDPNATAYTPKSSSITSTEA
ncbi:hypothetical protein B566_EDAN002948 [Ephemera danica]|nr:hypothetical protein B566_EDAN002948 [Ephemera danica]